MLPQADEIAGGRAVRKRAGPDRERPLRIFPFGLSAWKPGPQDSIGCLDRLRDDPRLADICISARSFPMPTDEYERFEKKARYWA